MTLKPTFDILADLHAALGDRDVVVCRELTKMFETITRVALSQAVAWLAADESRSLLQCYAERLQAYARIVTNDDLAAPSKKLLLQELIGDFPEGAAIWLYDGERLVESAYDSGILQDAGIERADLDAFCAAHPLPIEEIAGGTPCLRNASLSAAMPAFQLALAPLREAVRPAVIVSALVKADGLS